MGTVPRGWCPENRDVRFPVADAGSRCVFGTHVSNRKPLVPLVPPDDQILYVVNEDAPSGKGHCTLDDESVIADQFDRMEVALDATAGDPALRLASREELSREEQRRVEGAFLR